MFGFQIEDFFFWLVVLLLISILYFISQYFDKLKSLKNCIQMKKVVSV